MRYTIFGRTGQKVSALGFGAMNLHRVPFETAKAALNYALDQGINYIDTASAYRDSEEIIGKSIAHRRKEYFLATKVRARDYPSAKAEIERSLRRMNTDWVDLLQIHYVNHPAEFQEAMGENGAFRAALEAKKEGKVRFLGISGHRPELTAKWIAGGDFDQVLFHLSLVQPFALRDLIPVATKLNMGKTAMKPLSGGFVQPVEKALRFSYSQDVHVVLSGMTTVEEVKMNLAALEREVEPDERRELEALAERLGAHECRRCNYCSCPLEIRIPDVMISSRILETFELLPRGRKFYADQKERIIACASYEPCLDKPLCEPKCPYHLPMRQTIVRVGERLAASAP